MEEWVTVATFAQAVDAHIVKAKLESEGIEAFVADDNLLGVQPLYSAAIGGAKVQVRKSDFDLAREILNSTESLSLQHLSEVKCPSCLSKEVMVERKNLPLAIAAMLFFFIPLPILQARWKCATCGYYWRAK